MAKKIVLECNPDETLMLTLGMTRKEIQHQPNKGEVCNFQRKQNTPIAIVDEDPGAAQPKYLSNFSVSEEQHGIRVLKQHHSNRIILVICPMLEGWILERCRTANIRPEEYGLPSNVSELHKVINTRLSQFSDLLKAMRASKEPGIMYLSRLLEI